MSSCEALHSERGTGVLSRSSSRRQNHSREASGEFSRKSSKGNIENLKFEGFRKSKRSLSRVSLEQPLKSSLKNSKLSVEKSVRAVNDDIKKALNKKDNSDHAVKEAEEVPTDRLTR